MYYTVIGNEVVSSSMRATLVGTENAEQGQYITVHKGSRFELHFNLFNEDSVPVSHSEIFVGTMGGQYQLANKILPVFVIGVGLKKEIACLVVRTGLSYRHFQLEDTKDNPKVKVIVTPGNTLLLPVGCPLTVRLYMEKFKDDKSLEQRQLAWEGQLVVRQ